MYIYNVTTCVDQPVHEQWLTWMKQVHIPQVLSTGKFLGAKMTRVLVDENAGGSTYSVQFTVEDKATLQRYYKEDAPSLRQDALKRFGGTAVSFRTELEVVDEFLVQRPAATHLLFAYGTLQQKEVQLGVFSRSLNGNDDELTHYRISAQKVAGQYPTLEFTNNADHSTKGTVYTLSNHELERTDRYEGEAYQRILVTLASGRKAWAYMAVNP